MTNDRKTLVILTPGFAKDEADSTCIPTQQSFVQTLRKIYPGLHIIVLAFEYPYSSRVYDWFGNIVISFNGKNKGGLSRLLLRRRILRQLKKIHAAGKIDGLLSFWYGECAWVGKKFADKHSLKHFCWMWGQDARKNNKYVAKVKLDPDRLIAFSDLLQNEFKKNYRLAPAHVITPGINLQTFPSDKPAKDIDILAAGSLISLKQYSIFIEVIAEIKKTIPGIKAELIGEGPERKPLEDLIAKCNLQSNITLTGELAHPDVLKRMLRSKLFLHPSSYEGFGIVCIEALAAGCEVISFVRPMQQEIKNWDIVAGKEDMISKALAILQNHSPGYESVIPFTIEETARKMGVLFEFTQ